MERANQLEERRQEIEYAPLRDAGKPRIKTVISTPRADEWNERRRQRDMGETPDSAA
jgi:hypothetical protein